jgi:2,5-diamino-6-(ribosylamino)-4(3H)-pyrimidinone 5'-phosphate reductase
MRPFVFVNVAASIDGKISNERRVQFKISGEEDIRRVDELRASSDAIMVGIGTVLADDPKLTVKSERLRKKRVEEGRNPNPVRVIVDSRCRVPLNSKILNGDAPTIVAVSESADVKKIRRVSERAEVVVFGRDKVDLSLLMGHLCEKGIKTVMVEGGGTLISSLLKHGLVDEIYVYYGPIVIGGKDSPTICDGRSFEKPLDLELISAERLGEGLLTKWRVRYLTG